MMKELNLIYFSPTGSTNRVVNEIAKGISSTTINEIDITYTGVSKSITGTIIIGSPVYEGRLPKVFKERLSHLDLTDANCILVVVYGNRAYENSLKELKELVESKGATVWGAGAFIGEHSLSSKEKPIAEARPDKKDLSIAFDFGKRIQAINITKLKTIEIPGQYPLPESKPKPDVIIKTDENKCIKCDKCIDACPVGAIPKDNPLVTNGTLCLRCCACIKVCPVDARELNDPLSLNIAKRVFENCQQRKEPEIFI
ncbi:MAG: EFR1 family ferrodoxin [Marinifilaceae bacterium]